MKTASAKAKGRRLQQFVRDTLRVLGNQVGLQDEDIESRGMGQSGLDLILSPAAKRVMPLAIECKNVEKLNVPQTFWNHFEQYKDKGFVILVHSKNRTEPLVTLRFADFMKLVEESVLRELREKQGHREQANSQPSAAS